MTATVATAAAAEHSVSRSEDYDSLPSFLHCLLVYFGISARPAEHRTNGILGKVILVKESPLARPQLRRPRPSSVVGLLILDT